MARLGHSRGPTPCPPCPPDAPAPRGGAFGRLREPSRKNAYRHGISMEFAGPDAYQAYHEHPDHVRFVQERWLPAGAECLEGDAEPL